MEKLKLNLAPLIKEMEVFTKKGFFAGFVGEYLSAFKGRGLEFTGFKDYDQSDDASSIDWKASLRASKLLVRELVEERNLNVMFLFDVSSSMSFASVEKLKNEYAAELIATLSFAILNAGDAVGLIMFTDKIVKYLPPRLGSSQYYLILRALSDPKLYDGKYDISKVLSFVGGVLRSKSIVILVSDFIGLKGEWKQSLTMTGTKYELIGMMIRDPGDNLMPDVGQVVISDPFSEKEVVVNTSEVRKGYNEFTKRQVIEVGDAFKRTGSDFVHLTTDKSFIKSVTDLFRRRKRKWK